MDVPGAQPPFAKQLYTSVTITISGQVGLWVIKTVCLYQRTRFWRHAFPDYSARNNGRSMDNVRTDCGFDCSNFRLAGHVDRSKFNRIENEINLRFLLFSCFSCYLSSRCVLRNFDMKSW